MEAQEINKKEVGKRIYTIRKYMGLSLEQFGILLQASRRGIFSIKNEKTFRPSPSLFIF